VDGGILPASSEQTERAGSSVIIYQTTRCHNPDYQNLNLHDEHFSFISWFLDRLYGLVVRVLGYRSGGPGSIPGTIRFSEK
jgi:hypothetical protein